MALRVRAGPGVGGVVVALLLAAILLLPPVAAETGGPDSYGYVWVDSRAPSPVVSYAWVDITGAGTKVALAADDCSYELLIGFQFRFYGTLLDRLYVCSDGFVSFSLQSFAPTPPIPSPVAPNDRIVGLGMDLDPTALSSGGVYVRSFPGASPKRFVIEWSNVRTQFTTNQEQTFEIILEQNQPSNDGRIILQYGTLENVGTPLVGIENSTGSSGLAYPSALANNLAVAFLPPSDAGLPPDTMSVTPGVLAPGTTVQGTANVAMLRLDLSTASNEVYVSGIAVELSGLNADPGDVPTAALWLDDGDGTFSSATDSVLTTAAFTGSPSIAQFVLSPSLQVTMAAPTRVYIAFNLAPDADVGDWIGARMRDASTISLEFPDQVAVAGFPVNTYSAGSRTRIDASVDSLYLLAATDRAAGNVSQWESDVSVMSLRLGTDKNVVDLAGLNFLIGGNATPDDAWRLKVVEDTDHDGNYTLGADAVLAVAIPSGTPLAASLSFARVISVGAPADLLVLLDVGPQAAVGNQLNVTLNASGIRLKTGSADLVNPSNLPTTSSNATVVPGARPALFAPWSSAPPLADGSWSFEEYLLGPANTASFDRPAGNRVTGYLTVENNATMLFVGVDATGDETAGAGDGVAIGFDTDRDGAPTGGADDVFVANTTGGARLRYNATAAVWSGPIPCNAVGGNDSTPACAAAFGATELLNASHRFYEFAIPLDLLGVTTPVPPNTVLRFAMASPWHNGLVDGTNRSTWPILFAPLPSLGHFADVHLLAAPAPNQPPVLDWTGEPGYTADALEPEAGLLGDVFRWRVLYTDADNDPPTFAQPRLSVLRDGIPIPGSPFAMSGADTGDTTYVDGKVYVQSLLLNVCAGLFTYDFAVRDTKGAVASATVNGTGPIVGCPDLAPRLFLPSVVPPQGVSGTAFTYRVAYGDPEGEPPTFVEVTVALDGLDIQTVPMNFASWVSTPNDYAQGAWYDRSVILVQESSNYTFLFRAGDGNTTVDSGAFLGPEVVPEPPDRLTVTGSDPAPLVADEGDRLVPFLRLVLSTSDPEVNVTQIRVDRMGTATDASVERVLLFTDTDVSGSVTAGDVLLGSRPLLLGFAAFPVRLRVTPANWSFLLVVANLTRPGVADATVGFEILDPSSISVDPGDAVAPFPPIRSTRTVINVPPAVANPTVGGFAAATPGVTHLLVDSPTIAWQYTDANGADFQQVAANVSVWSDAPVALIWYRNESSTSTSAPYGGPALVPGASYRARIVASDGRLWSAVTEIAFRRNTPPTAPILLSPPDLATGVPRNATLIWQAITDPEGDTIRYSWWVSDNPGFTPTLSGTAFTVTLSLALAEGTSYYWKVGAGDGYEFAGGNTTVWRFTTASPPPPVRGEIRGRVLNGSVPIEGALVQLLDNGSVVSGWITPANGTFAFTDLDLRAYAVRASAPGYVLRLLAAEPTPSTRVVTLDIVLDPTSTPGDRNPTAFPWPLGVGLLVALAAAGFLAVVLLRRRRKSGEHDEAPPVHVATHATPKPASIDVRPVEVAVEEAALDDLARALDNGVPEPSPSAPGIDAVLFECPVCGRHVAADATLCVCGAIFEG